jgi:hypothetical protein
VDGDLVTQKGAVSVTNPDGTARPEVVQGYHHNFGVGGFLKQRSSLVPLGAYVMDWKDDYVALMNLFAKVADGYHAYFTNKTSFTLDFEYKKLVPGVLDVKQVREVPVINPTNMLPAFLVHETNSFWVMQGEAADVFSKSSAEIVLGLPHPEHEAHRNQPGHQPLCRSPSRVSGERHQNSARRSACLLPERVAPRGWGVRH